MILERTSIPMLRQARREPAGSPKARTCVLEFFGASIRNENTRKAYMACAAFFDFLADNDVTALEDVGPLHGAAYLEAMKEAKRSVATQKQHCGCAHALRLPGDRRDPRALGCA
jgi:hypothetical protein